MFGWEVIIDFGVLSLLLLFATLLRAKSHLIQSTLIPNALLAGFIGLVLRNVLLHFDIAILSTEMCTVYVYHLLNISFAALALSMPISIKSLLTTRVKGPISTGIYMTFILCIQCIVGVVITLFLIKTVYPDLFPIFGTMMAWGYTLGPGQAAAIGIGLEEFGFMHGASVGLIFGALGFVYACFVGILLIHWGIRKRKTTFVKTPEDIMGLSGILKKKPIAGRLTTSSEAIDTFTLQLALCGLVYIVVYAIIRAMTGEETGIVWGFAFIITAITGLIARSIFDRLHITDIIDAGLQTRIMNTCVDYLITAAIAAIPLIIIREYVIPIGLISISGMIITLFATIWLAPRIWKDHIFERLILCYGTLTGTISTGLALLRVVDPHFKSPAAMDYALGMWFCMFFMLPLMIIVNIPVYYGSEYTYYTLIGLTIFSIVLLLLWRVFGIWKK